MEPKLLSGSMVVSYRWFFFPHSLAIKTPPDLHLSYVTHLEKQCAELFKEEIDTFHASNRHAYVSKAMGGIL